MALITDNDENNFSVIKTLQIDFTSGKLFLRAADGTSLSFKVANKQLIIAESGSPLAKRRRAGGFATSFADIEDDYPADNGFDLDDMDEMEPNTSTIVHSPSPLKRWLRSPTKSLNSASVQSTPVVVKRGAAAAAARAAANKMAAATAASESAASTSMGAAAEKRAPMERGAAEIKSEPISQDDSSEYEEASSPQRPAERGVRRGERKRGVRNWFLPGPAEKFDVSYDSWAKRISSPLRIPMKSSNEDPEKHYMCTYLGCGKRFKTASGVRAHFKMHTDERPHPCPTCSKAFRTRSHLKEHYVQHGKTLLEFEAEREAARKEKEGDKVEKEEKKMSKETERKMKALKRVTVANPNLDCDVAGCGKTFTKPSSLKHHFMMHVDQRDIKCPICGKGFRNAGHLRVHEMTHTGERPHKCPECDFAFIERAKRNRHLQTVHKWDYEDTMDLSRLQSAQ